MGKRVLSRKEQEEQKKKEDEEAAAHVNIRLKSLSSHLILIEIPL